MTMFWGLILKPNKRYSQTVAKSFHISQAALDLTNLSDESTSLVLSSENSDYVVCTLRKNKVEQFNLDLNFAEGDEVALTARGGGTIHLTGYMIQDPDDYLGDIDDEEESGDEEVELTSKPKPQKKSQEKQPAEGKKNKIVAAVEEEQSDDESESEEENLPADDSSDDDEEDEEEEEYDAESDEAVQEPKSKKSKQNGLENGTGPPKEKLKGDKKKEKGQQPQVKGGEKILQGGVKIEDIRIGTGQEAKHGKKVAVFYEGRLKSNNKVFDSSKQGAGFKFPLGRGEVIKGWDIGVAGMKVGGKRRITCPPVMAYGARGSPPVIPPNSTLVFEVELKSVH